MTALSVPSALGQVMVMVGSAQLSHVTVVTTKLGGNAGRVQASGAPVHSAVMV